MGNRYLLFLICFLSMQNDAYSSQYTERKFIDSKGKKGILFEDADASLYLSKNCLDNQNCMALLEKSRIKELPNHFFAGKHSGMPEMGSLLCLSSKKNRIELVNDESGNELAICHYSDGSFLDTATLIYFWRIRAGL